MLTIPNLVKKIVALFLVFLLLFNALGFYGLLQGLRYKTALDLVHRLDNDLYAEDETLTIKVPIAIPYQLDSEDYERVDGEIEYEGELYRLVKQKFESDTLFIVCIKDHDSKRIKQALADYVKTFTDKPFHAKHSGKIFISLIKDFLPTSISLSAAAKGWNYSVTLESPPAFYDNRTVTVFTPPPRA
jgi:hypothetical protein